jgi:pimeloyl-ACP methyl ester carboxylesterase
VEPSEVRYARTVDGVNIAYRVRGDGPIDLVYTLGMAGNFEIEFEAPWGIRFLERLAAFSRVILFDKRGTGLSDRVLGAPDFEMRADDLRAVLDAAGSERAVLVGNRGGGEPRRILRRDAPRPGLCSRPLQLMGTDGVGT